MEVEEMVVGCAGELNVEDRQIMGKFGINRGWVSVVDKERERTRSASIRNEFWVDGTYGSHLV